MKKQLLCLVIAVCFACCAFAQDANTSHALRPFGKQPPSGKALTINYNGGPIFEVTPTVYIVYYGNWTNKDHNVINGFFQHLGGTTMDKINTTYSDSTNKFEPNAVNYNPTTDSYHDNYSLGHSVNDTGIQQIIANAISGGHLPNDTNGIYFVLTAKDVTDPDGFCSQFCGYHSPSTSIVSGEIIKYSMVGNPVQCPSGCEASAVIGDSNSPNNDPGADGVINIMWHEFSESTSDPEVNLQTAWAGSCGENGDCCAWQFGTLHTATNGSHYNEKFHNHEYITQMMLELQSKSRNGNVPGVCKNTF
jgi:hypothetical protein